MHTSAATPQIFLILKFVQARNLYFFFVYVSVELKMLENFSRHHKKGHHKKVLKKCGGVAALVCIPDFQLKVITPPSKVT